MKTIINDLVKQAPQLIEGVALFFVILIMAMLASTFLFYDFFLELLGLLLFGIQAGLFIIVAAGCVWLAWFSGDRLLMLLTRVEAYRQERARSAQEWAQVAVIDSQAALNLAQADAAQIVIESISPKRGALVVRGNSMQLVPALADSAALPEPEQPLLQQIDPVPLLLDALHLMVIGFTDGGKTTLMHHLATTWAQTQRVMVLDFDYAHGMWPGAEVSTENQVDELCRMLLDEFEDRRKQRRLGQRTDFTANTWRLIIDEYSAISDNKSMMQVVEMLLRRGRKYRLLVIIGIQDDQVRSLGWEGKGALRENFTYTVEAKIDPTTKQRTLKMIPKQGEPIACLTPNLPSPESTVRPVPGNGNGVQGAVQEPSVDVLKQYDGRERDVAECISKGWSKTRTRENVTGGNAEIGELYDRIKAELETKAAEPPPAKTIQLKKQPPPIALWAPGAGEVLQ